MKDASAETPSLRKSGFLRRVIQAYPDPSTVAWHRYGIHTLRQLARVHFSKTDRPVNVPAQVAA